MNDDMLMRVVYLLILLVCIGGSFWASMRQDLSKSMQQAAIWVLIFLGMLGGIGLYNDITNRHSPRQAVAEGGEIIAPRFRDGHYHLTLDVNGVPIDFLVDTGASQVVLTQDDARRVGLEPESLNYSGQASTANGIVRTAPVTLQSVALEGIIDRNLPAVVNDGQMDGSLLGMSYLESFRSIEIRDNALVLTR
ncbi:aspartyl protease family protein [Cognatiyoonia koreensis]|uniref:Aspartyl protease family protein n=1 Tax=Cognatiyoonia koreensis TaxID=364200 RepID=A0A1I0NYN7_9RHOB|nr:TIGR02281 family clan AA aspartic protease [Cognatiyoonia koreensis]SEW06926.1 aspartyl protease family protein [Cognatiyoonia koreensis]